MTDWKAAQAKAARTARWAMTMTKVRIRRTLARTKWHLVTFNGPVGGESVGIVDMLAVRKNHRLPKVGLKRGDLLDIVLIQVKGGTPPFPSPEEVARLSRVGRAYKAKAVLLATWKPGKHAHFFRLEKRRSKLKDVWVELPNPAEVFR